MKAASYDVFLCAWYRALNGVTPSKLAMRADPDDDRCGRGGCRQRAVRSGVSSWATDAVAVLPQPWPFITPYLGRTCTGWIAPAFGWRTHSITSSGSDVIHHAGQPECVRAT